MKTDDVELAALLSALLDGGLDETQQQRLNQLVQSSGQNAALVTDHLLMDSLLDEALGGDALSALVDVLGETETEPTATRRPADPVASDPSGDSVRGGRAMRTLGWLVSVVVAAMFLVTFMDRGGNEVFADASDVIVAAVAAHESAVERVYSVSTRSRSLLGGAFRHPDDVRVFTQGNQFWVQMNEDPKWSWGRQSDGTIWLALDTQRAMTIAADEIGPPLHEIAELYSVNWESLLLTLLDGFELEKRETESTYEITATPDDRQRRWFRGLEIVVDRETKAVRRLVLHRRKALFGESIMTFELLEARSADASAYRLEGHLSADAVVYSRDSPRDPRLRTLVNRFGNQARRWIVSPDQNEVNGDAQSKPNSNTGPHAGAEQSPQAGGGAAVPQSSRR
ncbi:MAG: hypothetical protein NXI04_16400 [Planctomycetaceae bacterium]|nr:hypothetical protein [Planctomycetaceae bacterium]